MVSTNVSPYAISGYNHVLRTRGTRKGGGLSLFVSEKLVHCEMADHCMAQSDTRMCSERHLYIHVYTNVYISKYSEYGCVCAHTWVFKCMYTCTRIWILHWCLSNTCYIYIYITLQFWCIRRQFIYNGSSICNKVPYNSRWLSMW